jgi:hypothetical protein
MEHISPTANNRLGVVFSALYNFWIARQAALNGDSTSGGGRRDAYSLLFFNRESSMCIEHDLTSSPDELLTAALLFEPDGGKNFTIALEKTRDIMDSHWSMERYRSHVSHRTWFNAACDSLLELEMRHRPPVVIFLSDGDDNVNDEAIYDVCRSAVGEGFVGFYLERCFSRWTHNLNARRPLSFHAVSFGQDPTTSSLRRMAQIALEVQKIAQIYLKAQNNTPDNPSQPTAATVPSSYTEALDTVSWRQSSFHFMSFIFGRIRSA